MGKSDENNLRGLNSQEKAFVDKLLKMTNARVIGTSKFNSIVDKTAKGMWKLDNFIVNLPPEKEAYMRHIIQGGLDRAARIEEAR